MSKKSKLRDKILSGKAQNIEFADLCTFLQQIGFSFRQESSHHIFTRDQIQGVLVLEPTKEGKAKSYQVRQVRGNGAEKPVMKATDYSVFIIWSKEDNAFSAQVPELPECVADGATREEALANATIAAQIWIDTAKELGREIPEPQTLEFFEPVDSETQLRIAVEAELEKIIPELILRVTASISPMARRRGVATVARLQFAGGGLRLQGCRPPGKLRI
jgi:predicted RNase H-like HicB family nuclease